MKILEVKNNLVKISYTAQDDLVISGFVIIEDSQYPYVAQVMSLKADGGINYAIVKLLFTFNNEGVVKNYNGAIPELNANITRLSAEELLDILPIENPLKIGKLAQQKFVLNVDWSTLERNLLICSDNIENTDVLISNLAKQITENNEKSVIFDTTNTINAENKISLGKDFKLPLNYDTINFIYEHDLNDIDATSKAVLQDILLEVQEYSKTVLDKFIPFDSFINVVDAQYKQLKLPELALLKNRLIKYKEENIFAQEAKELHRFRGTVRANLSTLVDISSVDSVLQNLALHTLYNEILNMDLFIYSFVKVDNDNIDKRLLKKFINQEKIYSTVVCGHNFKYLYELKEIASNMILFAPQSLQHDFNSYNVFLNKLNQDEFIIYGKSTQNIPLIIENLTMEDLVEYEHELNEENNSEVSKDTVSTDTSAEIAEEETRHAENSFEEDSYSQESMIDDDIQTKEDFDDQTVKTEDDTASDTAQPLEISEIPIEDNSLIPLEEYDESKDSFDIEDNNNNTVYNDSFETIEDDTQGEFIDLPEDNMQQNLAEDTNNAENSDSETEEDAPLNDIDEFSSAENIVEAQSDEEIVTDDKSEDLPIINDAEIIEDPAENSNDNLTEDDLDFIDNIKEDELINDESISVDKLQEEPLGDADINISDENIDITEFDENYDEAETSNSTDETPIVPIYPADEDTPVAGYQVEFEAGDRVTHPKYGEGVVEKMVKFGNKVLCAISFANGRRLLDPTISQIEKI